MSDKDFGVSVTAVPQVGHVSKKPCYLVSLDGLNAKTKSVIYFIAMDKPDLLTNFIQVKGVYSDLSEDEITKKFNDILASTSKESFIDIMFPSHRVNSIKSLVFNANKPSTLIK
jgi:hypothetical protein